MRSMLTIMEAKKKLSTGAVFCIVVLAILSVLGLVAEFIGTIRYYSTAELVPELIPVTLCAVITAFVAGKPNKITKNSFLLVLSLLHRLQSVCRTSGNRLFRSHVWDFVPLIMWLDLVFAYILRYREHKEAELTNKS